jgi:hypothetical protein
MVIIIAIIRPLSPLAHSKEQWIFDFGCVRQLYAAAPKTLSSLLFWVLTAVKLSLCRDSAQWRLNYKIPRKPQPPQRHAVQFAHSSNKRENFGETQSCVLR